MPNHSFWIVLDLLIYRIYRAYNPVHGLLIPDFNQQTTVKVKLMHIRHDPSLYNFSAKRFVSFLTVLGLRKPTLQVKWPELCIIHKMCNLVFHLPEYYRISYFTGLKLQEIFANQYYVLLFVKGSDKQFSLVRLVDTDWHKVQPIQPQNPRGDPLSVVSINPVLPSPPVDFRDNP